MNDFGDLLGTPYAPVSKIAPVNVCIHVKVAEIQVVISTGQIIIHKIQ